ncbi:hypothetical protein CTA1_1576 [Colletotrichum tanaceti]|uniref:Uncharacterized protein n=1 Tax=Colletotrichum tanaceti TaxID=1306861 RepID=A0A4U6XM27_9PEZI|nr:hypothetical protein CTA1_1576 [Colletotrichum tanaceti]
MTSAALPTGYPAPKGGDGGLESEVASEDVVLVARPAPLDGGKGGEAGQTKATTVRWRLSWVNGIREPMPPPVVAISWMGHGVEPGGWVIDHAEPRECDATSGGGRVSPNQVRAGEITISRLRLWL